MGRVANAWRQAAFRLDDPAVRQVPLQRLARQPSQEGLVRGDPRVLGVDITYLHKGKFDPATLTALLKVIDRKQIDILHLHGYGATTFGRLAGKMRRIPTVLHEHANLTDTPWFQKIADRALAPSTDIAIAVSKSTADFVINARQMPAQSVKTVYLGVPLDEFSRTRTAEEIAAARAELGIRAGEFAAGTVTRLHESKGNSYLVESAALVLKERPHARFFLVGEGPLLPDLQAQAQALGLGDRFVFHGFARDVAAVVSAFDLSVFPSLWEGTPLTVFEALAMGKTILATDADGLLDVLTDDRDAMIVPKRDARALADGIVRLMDDPALRTRLGAEAARTSLQYDIATFVRKMERLYEILHRVSRATNRRGVLAEDLSFLETRVPDGR